MSYSQVAHRIGAPKAVRAVGAAIGANPLAVAIPCHRVIAMTDRSAATVGGRARVHLSSEKRSHSG